MITVNEATAIIFDHLFKPDTTVVKSEAASGKVLAEQVTADRDFPPFHRVAMDGIGISHQAWISGQRTFLIEGIQAAGETQKTLSF
jgi:molybdopterin molybdotransferase